MIQVINRTKRQTAYLLAYMMLISMIQPFVLKHVSAANSKKLYGAGMTFLQPANISTEAGIVISGAGTVVINGNTYELIQETPDIGETTSGGGADAGGESADVASGGSADVTSGGSADVTSGGSADVASGGSADVASGGSADVAGGGSADVASGGSADVASGGSADVASGESIVLASGTAVDLRYGLSKEFEIGEYGAPAMFSIVNGIQSGNCAQFRVINSASKGFHAWLVDGTSNELMYRVDGLGGQNVWRVALEQRHTYYLLLSGEEGSSGKLLMSDIMDDHGDSFNQATTIALNKDQSIETEVDGDVDILAFNAVAAVSSYRIQIDSVLGNRGSYALYDHNGKAVSGCSGTMGTSRVTKAFTATPGKRYYFRFSSDQTGRKIVVKIIQSTTKYKITYYLNGGKNASGNIKSYVSTLSKYTLKNATRSKYIFGGWYTDAGCTNRIYNIYGSNRKNFQLYAKWIKVVPQKPSIKFLKSKKQGQVKIKWKKQKDVKGYQIIYGTTRSLQKGVKKKKLTQTSLTLKKMKPGTVYYFKVCAYSLDSKGKKIYSGYSKVKKVKVKPKNAKKKPARAAKKKPVKVAKKKPAAR